tara:strand:+ start:3020 stop:4876 length:1857 start_codon:yes stop_codon:yes gene_type:complete
LTTPIYTTGPQKTDFTLSSEFTAPLSDVVFATGEEAWWRSPLSSLVRGDDLRNAQGQKELTPEALGRLEGITRPVDRRFVTDDPKSYRLTPGTGKEVLSYETYRGAELVPEVFKAAEILSDDEARERIEAAGVKLKIPAEGTTDLALNIRIEAKQKEMRIKEVLSRSPEGLAAGAAKLGVGLAVTMLDPINVASAFIPIVGQARIASMLRQSTSRLKRAGIRARAGAVEGAVGASIVEPIVLGQARREEAEYGLMDSLLNVTFGAVMGGGLHAGIGGIADASGKFRLYNAWERAYDEMGHAEREAELRSSISMLVDDRYVNVEILGNFTPVRLTERKVYVPGEEVEFIAPSVDEAAREINPEVVGRFEDIEAQKADIREQITASEPRRLEISDTVMRSVDEEISEMLDRLDPRKPKQVSAKSRKQITKRLSKLEDEREDFLMKATAEDTLEMAALRRRLVDLDVQQRDIAVEYSQVIKEARARTDSEGSTVAGRSEPSFEVTKAWEVDRNFDMAEEARATMGVKNDRFADVSAADEATIRVREAEARDDDPLTALDDEIAGAREELDTLYERTGLTEDEMAIPGDESMTVRESEELIAEVEESNTAVETFSMCMARRG